jgi:LysR family cys regulon transcriptional activator
VGIIAGPSYEPSNDNDLVALDLSHLIPRSVTKIAYLKHLYLPSYLNFFINELLAKAQEQHGIS